MMDQTEWTGQRQGLQILPCSELTLFELLMTSPPACHDAYTGGEDRQLGSDHQWAPWSWFLGRCWTVRRVFRPRPNPLLMSLARAMSIPMKRVDLTCPGSSPPTPPH